MNKQTKAAITIAILGVGGFLLYKNFTANKKNYTANPVGQRKKLYTGQAGQRKKLYTGEAGKRQKNLTSVLNVKETNWVRYNGAAPKDFFAVKEGFK